MSSDLSSATVVTRVGRYDVTSEVGRGGMGVVYPAEDKLIGREIAIKILTESTPELRERFYIEARSGILNHLQGSKVAAAQFVGTIAPADKQDIPIHLASDTRSG